MRVKYKALSRLTGYLFRPTLQGSTSSLTSLSSEPASGLLGFIYPGSRDDNSPMHSSSAVYMPKGGSVTKYAAVSERTKFSGRPDGASHVGHGDASVLADVVDDLNGQLG
jgi:hypothetical protein